MLLLSRPTKKSPTPNVGVFASKRHRTPKEYLSLAKTPITTSVRNNLLKYPYPLTIIHTPHTHNAGKPHSSYTALTHSTEGLPLAARGGRRRAENCGRHTRVGVRMLKSQNFLHCRKCCYNFRKCARINIYCFASLAGVFCNRKIAIC